MAAINSGLANQPMAWLHIYHSDWGCISIETNKTSSNLRSQKTLQVMRKYLYKELWLEINIFIKISHL